MDTFLSPSDAFASSLCSIPANKVRWALNVSWLCLKSAQSDICEPFGPSLIFYHLSTQNDSSTLRLRALSSAVLSVASLSVRIKFRPVLSASRGQCPAPRLLLACSSDAEGSLGSAPSEYISSSSSLSVAGDPQQEPLYGRHGSYSQEARHSIH